MLVHLAVFVDFFISRDLCVFHPLKLDLFLLQPIEFLPEGRNRFGELLRCHERVFLHLLDLLLQFFDCLLDLVYPDIALLNRHLVIILALLALLRLCVPWLLTSLLTLQRRSSTRRPALSSSFELFELLCCRSAALFLRRHHPNAA